MSISFKTIFSSVTSKIGGFSSYAKAKSTALKTKWNSPEVQNNIQSKGSKIVDSLQSKTVKLDDYRHNLKNVGPKDPYKETWAKYSKALASLFGGVEPQSSSSSEASYER